MVLKCNKFRVAFVNQTPSTKQGRTAQTRRPSPACAGDEPGFCTMTSGNDNGVFVENPSDGWSEREREGASQKKGFEACEFLPALSLSPLLLCTYQL